jgi:hypothetical protein
MVVIFGLAAKLMETVILLNGAAGTARPSVLDTHTVTWQGNTAASTYEQSDAIERRSDGWLSGPGPVIVGRHVQQLAATASAADS